MYKPYTRQIQIWVDCAPFRDKCLIDWTDEEYEEFAFQVAEKKALESDNAPEFLYVKERFVPYE